MKKVSIVYDGYYPDTDIIALPDDIAAHIQDVIQEFHDWIYDNPDLYPFWKTDANGYRYPGTNAERFIWWLNQYRLKSGEQASVFRANCWYRPWYPRGDF